MTESKDYTEPMQLQEIKHIYSVLISILHQYSESKEPMSSEQKDYIMTNGKQIMQYLDIDSIMSFRVSRMIASCIYGLYDKPYPIDIEGNKMPMDLFNDYSDLEILILDAKTYHSIPRFQKNLIDNMIDRLLSIESLQAMFPTICQEILEYKDYIDSNVFEGSIEDYARTYADEQEQKAISIIQVIIESYDINKMTDSAIKEISKNLSLLSDSDKPELSKYCSCISAKLIGFDLDAIA